MASKVAKNAVKEVYRGYIPEGLPQHRPRQRVKPWWKVEGRPRVTVYPQPMPIDKKDQYTEEPQYPPLNDGSASGLKRQVRLDWYEKLKTLPTAEMKMHEITRHCDHYIAHFNNWLPNYNSLPMIKYMTRTHLVESLPLTYQDQIPSDSSETALEHKDDIDSAVEKILLDQIALDLYESHKIRPRYVSKTVHDSNRNQYLSSRFIQNMITNIKGLIVSEKNDQILDYQYDYSPALRSWWYHSGFAPPNSKPFYRSRKDDDGNINQMIQMDGAAALNIRSDSLLEPVLSLESDTIKDENLVEKFNYSLRFYGAYYKFKKPVTLPGFWFEEKPRYDCPHTCFLSMDCLSTRSKKVYDCVDPLDDRENCLNGQAIMTAFGWLNSLSCYHGFTPFHELVYPFTCQVVTTNGQDWLFNVYQFNSHAFHRDLGNPIKNNICWSSGILRLYGAYEDGQFKDVNKDVIRLLVKFMSKQTSPSYTQQLNLRPYLGEQLDANEEESNTVRKELRRAFEQRANKFVRHKWSVPLYEHVYYRSKEMRHKIIHDRPLYHLPKPKYPNVFE